MLTAQEYCQASKPIKRVPTLLAIAKTKLFSRLPQNESCNQQAAPTAQQHNARRPQRQPLRLAGVATA